MYTPKTPQSSVSLEGSAFPSLNPPHTLCPHLNLHPLDPHIFLCPQPEHRNHWVFWRIGRTKVHGKAPLVLRGQKC